MEQEAAKSTEDRHKKGSAAEATPSSRLSVPVGGGGGGAASTADKEWTDTVYWQQSVGSVAADWAAADARSRCAAPCPAEDAHYQNYMERYLQQRLDGNDAAAEAERTNSHAAAAAAAAAGADQPTTDVRAYVDDSDASSDDSAAAGIHINVKTSAGASSATFFLPVLLDKRSRFRRSEGRERQRRRDAFRRSGERLCRFSFQWQARVGLSVPCQ